MSRCTFTNCTKLLGNFFVLFVFLVVSFIYINVIQLYLTHIEDIPNLNLKIISFLSVFHILIFMFLWSFFKAMLTDPGMVPPLWGFYMGDAETKRRRYCLMCHVFKPERCHHCSACNRCVLNMDHHCPWLNNCVGFFNRKFFILVLFYVLNCLYIAVVVLSKPAYGNLLYIIHTRDLHAYSEAVLIGAFLLSALLSVMLTLFMKFHIKLILTNSTTIEQMDKKAVNRIGIYNKGTWRNWIQVFGQNPWLWLLPMTGATGKQIGDGVVWNNETRTSIDELPPNESKPANIAKPSPSIPIRNEPSASSKIVLSPPLSKIRRDSPPDERVEVKVSPSHETKRNIFESASSTSTRDQMLSDRAYKIPI
ncbi:unnamed protein product [Blepharisma stoltei]|uniref:Palmitoyltransferase n=1 Tax=Blepharisma stoltei TaxID=1481888 RepID=A0AAU9JN63_9CILI|nr:unnamed protein product [Blepharisma stoltei]